MEINTFFTSNRTPVMFLVFGIIAMAVSGIFFGLFYFVLDTTNTAFLNTDCTIEGNAFFSTCQEVWTLAVYPFLAIKDILIYLSIFFIFILVIGMLLTGYNSGTKPSMLGLLLLLEIAFTYGSFYIANIYRLFLANPIILNAMTNFSVYNKIMLNFPWFVFVISLFSLALGVVNWQRVRTNTPTGELDY